MILNSISLAECSSCRTEPDAPWSEPVLPQTLAHFQSIRSTEVELPHTRQTQLCNQLSKQGLDVLCCFTPVNNSLQRCKCRRHDVFLGKSHLPQAQKEFLSSETATCRPSADARQGPLSRLNFRWRMDMFRTSCMNKARVSKEEKTTLKFSFLLISSLLCAPNRGIQTMLSINGHKSP